MLHVGCSTSQILHYLVQHLALCDVVSCQWLIVSPSCLGGVTLQEVIDTKEAVCLAGLALISVISLTSCAAPLSFPSVPQSLQGT